VLTYAMYGLALRLLEGRPGKARDLLSRQRDVLLNWEDCKIAFFKVSLSLSYVRHLSIISRMYFAATY